MQLRRLESTKKARVPLVGASSKQVSIGVYYTWVLANEW